MRFRACVRGSGSGVALALLVSLAGCNSDPTGPQDPEDVAFAEVLGIDLDNMTRLESGVYIQTTRQGQDPAVTATSRIRANYALWLPDATPIQSGGLNNQDVNGLIPGFTQGVIGMKTGEIRWIVIPSELGYGATGAGDIPPHSVLVFQVELLEVQS